MINNGNEGGVPLQLSDVNGEKWVLTLHFHRFKSCRSHQSKSLQSAYPEVDAQQYRKAFIVTQTNNGGVRDRFQQVGVLESPISLNLSFPTSPAVLSSPLADQKEVESLSVLYQNGHYTHGSDSGEVF